MRLAAVVEWLRAVDVDADAADPGDSGGDVGPIEDKGKPRGAAVIAKVDNTCFISANPTDRSC
jgi:hypothetical protein